jgi:ATP:ADP antiporter, AAA family
MIKSLLRILNVKQEEETQVLLMLGTGFFMGIFLATYQVTAESLFINKLSDQLDKAFLISGILGILSTAVFSFFQNIIKFTTLTILSILGIVVISFTLYFLYHIGNEQQHKIVLFAMFCLIGPITAILLLCYWGVFGRLFNFKQSKRIIGWIDTGQLVAQVLAYFIIPLTIGFFPDTSNYLIVCNISILCSLVFLVVISFRFTLTKNDPSAFEETVKDDVKFSRIFKDPYVVLLSAFLIISMIIYIFSQYSFQTLINQQYPDQKDLTKFLAYFMGAIYGLSLIMQTFVNDRIIGNYGIRVSLLVLPVIVGIFSLGAFLSGSLLGYSPASGGFIFFFLFAALTRLFNGSLRDSLESPVFKLLFIPIDSRLRFGIQAKVEGVINESGRLIAGLIIFLFGLLTFFRITWISLLIMILVGTSAIIINKLYLGYRNKIRSRLEGGEMKQDKLEVGFAQITSRLEKFLVGNSTSKAVFSFKLLEKINPAQVPFWVNNLMKHQQEDAQDFAQRRMNEIKGLSVSERYIIKFDSRSAEVSDKNILSSGDLQMIIDSGGNITKARVQKLSRSAQTEDRLYAAELLLHSSTEENTSFLIELLNDPEPKVRQTAIKTAAKKNSNEVIFALIENLGNPLYSNEVINTLVLIGPKSLNFLDNAFYHSGQSTQILLRTIQVMGRIGGQRAKDLLWNKIDYPDKVVVSQVLLSLGECGFKAGISQITRIKYAIESDIADISWNLSAIQEIGNDENASELIQALQRENQNDIEHIYMLLAMLYDTHSIQLVKENIESGTAEGATYAVELLDVFLSEQLKQRVIPVLDDISDTDKINRLEDFYPRVRLDEKLVLKFLINRDFTQANRWTKACVIRQIGRLRIADFTLDLIAQLFNPDQLVSEIAAWALFKINPEIFHSNVARLDEETQKMLNEAVLSQGGSSSIMVLEKVLFYQRIPVFEGIPGITLSYLADISEEVKLKSHQIMSMDEKLNNDFYIIYNGAVNYYSKGEHVSDYHKGQFIGEMLSLPGFANTNQIRASEDTTLLRIDKDLFYELVADNVKLADRILEFI